MPLRVFLRGFDGEEADSGILAYLGGLKSVGKSDMGSKDALEGGISPPMTADEPSVLCNGDDGTPVGKVTSEFNGQS